VPPYRARPCPIPDSPRYDMHVKLTNHVAKRANIDLVRSRMGFQEARSPACLFHQLRLADEFKIDQFDQAFPPRHENEPGQRESFINSARHSGKSPMTNVFIASLSSRTKVIRPRRVHGTRAADPA
jgi:hypothetical protein